MIVIYLDFDKYQYDVHSLFKAFYPEEEIMVLPGEKGSFPEKEAKITDKDEVYSYSGIEHIEKNQLKKTIYEELSGETGKKLPWGNLTGIRPTRIAMSFMEEGKNDAEVESLMKNTYFVSDEKTKLCLEIAHREKEVLKGIDYENGYSLYIGIPFCPTTCLYCSFTSYPIFSQWGLSPL